MAPPSAMDPQAVADTQAAVRIGPLSIDGVPSRRLKAAKMASGVAPFASSDMFKGPVSSCFVSRVKIQRLMYYRFKINRRQSVGTVCSITGDYFESCFTDPLSDLLSDESKARKVCYYSYMVMIL